MNAPALSARELERRDVERIADYWANASRDLLLAMGVEPAKLPPRSEFVAMLEHQLDLPLEERRAYGTIWEVDGEPVGHCNVNRIVFGREAYMHLHLWQEGRRHGGLGPQLIRCSLPWFFERLKLEELYCEPYALNPAPNRALEKAGFDFIQEYTTIPGAINFVQRVKRWHVNRAKYRSLGIPNTA